MNDANYNRIVMPDKRQGLFSRLFGAPVEQRSEPLAGVIPPPRSAATNVTVERALGHPTVYRCVNIIAGGVMQLGLETERDGQVIPSPLIVRQPDSNRSLASFLKRTTFNLASHGNAYWKITFNTNGQANNLEVLNPADVAVDRDAKGNKRYKYLDKTFTDKQVKHLRQTELFGHEYGLSPITLCKEFIAGDLDLRTYANATFKRGVPAIYLSTDQELDPEQADAIEKRWYEKTENGNVPVTGKGIGPKPIGMSLEDLQFIQTQQHNDLQIVRAFGIEPGLLGVPVQGKGLTYNNRQDLDVQFVRGALMPYLIEIEDALSSVLPRGTTVKFTVDDFIRAWEATPNQPKESVTDKAA